jgi:predicted 3-demethylubiquinone-9 3-methyltransferase (glyoxalase superfamily)
MKTGFFIEDKMLQLLDPVDEEGTATYAIQYFCENMETLERYWREKAPALQADHTGRFKDKFLAFRTVMEVI